MRFWDASGVALTPLYKLSTANVFHTDCDPCDDPPDPDDDPDMQQEEEWPPFRKVRAKLLVPSGVGSGWQPSSCSINVALDMFAPRRGENLSSVRTPLCPRGEEGRFYQLWE